MSAATSMPGEDPAAALHRAMALIGDPYDAGARDAARFLADLVSGWDAAWYINLCALAPDNSAPPEGRSWAATDVAAQATEITAWIAGQNRSGRGVYFTTNPLCLPVHGKPKNANVAAVAVLNIDADPDVAAAGSYGAAREALWRAVDGAVGDALPPSSCVVDTGNGAGVFYRLPVPLSVPEGTAAGRALQAHARGALAGVKVDSTADEARLMRLPFTRNWTSPGKRDRGYPAGEDSPWASLRGVPSWAPLAADTLAALVAAGPGTAERTDPASAPQEAHQAPNAATVAALVRSMPNPADVDRAQWLDIVRMIRAAASGLLEDDGEVLAREWSERWEGGDHDEAAFAKAWRSLAKPSHIGWRRLVRVAEDLGSSLPQQIRFAEAVADFALVALPEARSVAGSEQGRFQLLTMDDCAPAGTAREYVIKGVLARGDVGILLAPPGAGKSALAPYIAQAVATGRPVFDRRVRQGSAMYVAAEDPHGMRGRFRALGIVHGSTPDLFLVPDSVDLLDAAQRDEIIQLGIRCRAALVIVDTLAEAFPGIEENDGKDMGRVVRALRDIARRTGAAVLVIHHTPISNPSAPRGHSSLNGSADVTLRIAPPPGTETTRTVTFGKNRNGPSTGLAWHFVVEGVSIGVDADGEPEDAAVAREVATGPRTGPRLSKASKVALAALYAAMKADGVQLPAGDGFPAEGARGVSVAAWEAECARQGLSGAEDPKGRRRAFSRARDALREASMIDVRDGLAWPLR